MKQCVVGCCLALLMVGCEGGAGPNEQVAKLGSAPDAISWAELDALQSEGLMGISYALDAGDKAGAIAVAKKDSFGTVVDQLEQSAAPSGVSASEKGEIVKQARALIESANGDGASFAETFKQLREAINAAAG